MLKPVGDKIIIKIAPNKQVTKGGIIIPELVAKEQQTSGVIVGIGQKVTSDIKIGDKLLISKHSGTKISHEEEDFLIVREPDILAVC